MPFYVRMRVYALLGALIPLAGCGGERLPPPVIDTSMPVVLDYREHRVLNPPPRRDQGRVDPVPSGPGRVREFGPESQLSPGVGPSALLATLERFRAREPREGHTVLGLAKKKKSRTAKAEPAPDSDPANPDAAYDADTSDPAPIRVPDVRPGRQARADTESVKDVEGGYKLNFDDADVKDVIQAVLGGVLHISYTLAPNIIGKVTISSAAPQNRDELLSTLEGVLAMQGLSMIPTATGYRITPMALGGGVVDTNGQRPGFGITVVPLDYSSAPSVMKLVTGFLTDADGVRVDAARNTIIVRGPEPKRDEIVRAIKNFDADWMHTQSVSVVELRRSNPAELIGELDRIFDTEKDTGGALGSIQFKAIPRLRAIMVISRSPQLVRRATVWIRRLDHQDTSAAPGIYVYRPQYREARELVRLVKGLFGVSGGGSSGGEVSFQNGGAGQGAGQGQNQGLGGQGQNGTIGQSSASFAGGLSNSGFGGGSGGGVSGGGGGGAGLSGSPFGGAQGGGVGGAGFGSSAGGGLGGTGGQPGGPGGRDAEPIEAGRGGEGGEKSKLSLTADTGNNSIVAYTDGETYAKVHAVLRQLDLPPLQVAINVTVAEVDLNDALKYGVQFYLNNMPGQVSLQATAQQGLAIASTVAAATATAGAVNGINGGFGSFGGLGGLSGIGGLGGLGNVGGFGSTGSGVGTQDIILSALDSVTKVHILSNPSIVVMENKPATFEVGNQVPVTTQSAQSTIGTNSPTLNQVQYLDTGVILKIIPRVGQKGEVDMDLDQIISSVVPLADGTQSLTPTISKRRVASNISVRSGQTVMLAGLVQDQRQRSRGQLPFVGEDIGSILGNTNNSFTRTELVIFINPIVIRGGRDAAAVAGAQREKYRTIDLHPPRVTK